MRARDLDSVTLEDQERSIRDVQSRAGRDRPAVGKSRLAAHAGQRANAKYRARRRARTARASRQKNRRLA